MTRRRWSSTWRWIATASLLAVLVGLAAWSSVRTVARDEQGVVLRFGRVVEVEPPGMHFGLPWPIERMDRVQSAQVRTMPVGFRFVDNLRGRPPSAEEVQWLTGDRNIIELKATVLYSVRDPVEYLFASVSRADGSARDPAIRSAAESVLTALLASMSIDDVLASGKTTLQVDAAKRVQSLIDDFHLGVDIRGVSIANVNPPARVVSAFNDVQSARADRERSISEAAGYAAGVLPKARADADRDLREAEIFRAQTVESARGAAQAFEKLASEIQKRPDLGRHRLWLDIVRPLFGRGRRIVVGRSANGVRPTVFLER